MPELKLYYSPWACSQVTLTALEHIGCDYQHVPIDLAKGQQRDAQYLAINPRGKVPALLVDDELLTENSAILLWLNKAFPDAGLLPTAKDNMAEARQISDLFWLSSVWHPYARALMMPIRWTIGDEAPVRERGRMLFETCIAQLEEALADREWWYGEWSIVDVYFYWCCSAAIGGSFDLSPYPRVLRHRQAVEQLPAFIRALEREQQTQ